MRLLISIAVCLILLVGYSISASSDVALPSDYKSWPLTTEKFRKDQNDTFFLWRYSKGNNIIEEYRWNDNNPHAIIWYEDTELDSMGKLIKSVIRRYGLKDGQYILISESTIDWREFQKIREN